MTMTRKMPSQLFTVTGEYFFACTSLPIASNHPSMSVLANRVEEMVTERGKQMEAQHRAPISPVSSPTGSSP